MTGLELLVLTGVGGAVAAWGRSRSRGAAAPAAATTPAAADRVTPSDAASATPAAASGEVIAPRVGAEGELAPGSAPFYGQLAEEIEADPEPTDDEKAFLADVEKLRAEDPYAAAAAGLPLADSE